MEIKTFDADIDNIDNFVLTIGDQEGHDNRVVFLNVQLHNSLKHKHLKLSKNSSIKTSIGSVFACL